MLQWILMGSGFLFGYLIGFYGKKISEQYVASKDPAISPQVKVQFHRRRMISFMIFGFYLSGLVFAVIMNVVILRTISLEEVQELIAGTYLYIIPGLSLGLVSKWLVDRYLSHDG